jgi:hypothetical protein
MNTNLPLKHQIYDNSVDKIKAWYLDNDVPITEKEIQLKGRWERMYALLNSDEHSPEEAVRMHCEIEKVSIAVAYRDRHNATVVFGDIGSSKKDAYRNILYEYAFSTYKAAKEEGNYKQMNAAIANMIKIKGLDKEEIDLPDPEKLKPSQQYIQINIEFLNSKFYDEIDAEYREELDKLLSKMHKLLDEHPIAEILGMKKALPLPKK